MTRKPFPPCLLVAFVAMLIGGMALAAAPAAGERVEVRLTLPLEADEFSVSRRPRGADFHSDDPTIAAWFGEHFLPRDDPDWARFGEPLTLESLLLSLPEWAAGHPPPDLRFEDVDVTQEPGQLTFTLNYVRAPTQAIDLWIETSWLPPGATPRQTDTAALLAQLAKDGKLPGLPLAEAQPLRAPGARTLRVFFTPPDFPQRPSDGDQIEAVPPPLAAAALLVALAAEQHGFGRAAGQTRAFVDEVVQRLKAAFPQVRYPGPRVHPQSGYVRVSGFAPLAGQEVAVRYWHGFDGATLTEERVELLRQRGYDHAALQRRVDALGTAFTARLNHDRPLPEPAYLTEAETLDRAHYVQRLPRIGLPPTRDYPALAGSDQRLLRFEVSYHPALREATADAKYTPDQGLLGGATYTSRNRFAVGDEGYAGFAVGDKRQDAEAHYQSRGHTSGAIPEWHARLGATYSTGEDNRFGQGSALADLRTIELALEGVLQVLRPDELGGEPGWRQSLVATPRAGWTDQRLTAPPAFFDRDRGYRGIFTGLAVEFAARRASPPDVASLASTPPHFVSRQTWRAALDAEHIWPERGDRFSVARATGEVQGEFGPRGERHYLLGLAVMGGVASSGVPLSRVLRGGGEEWLRGLDEGELLGRRVAVVRLEGGFDPFRLLGRRGVRPDAAPFDATATPAVTDAPFLAVAAVEHGWSSHDDLAINAPALRRAASYSLGIDYQGAMGAWPFQLRLGYAWSPEGLRDRGRIYTAYRLVFPVRSPTTP